MHSILSKSLTEVNNNIQIALASGKRIFDLIDEPIEVIEKSNVASIKTFNDSIVYENVSFRYNPNSDMVLKDINLEVKKNQRIALVGSSA